MEKHHIKSKFVLCIETRDCEDLEVGKVYRVVPDENADADDYIRIIDESGEDYLYPRNYFVPVTIPQKAEDVLAKAG